MAAFFRVIGLIVFMASGAVSAQMPAPAPLNLPQIEAVPQKEEVARDERWTVYYGSSLPPEDFVEYDTVVFDSREHPPLRLLLNQSKLMLGYLSIGEAENYREDFEAIKKLGVLMEENKYWPGHYIIDIRKPEWTKYLIEKKIPEILFKRFDGLMFDTLDSPLYLEEQNPMKYKGMKEGAIRMLREIRMHFPEVKIMLNRGLHVLEDVAPDIDMILAESTLVDHNTDDKTYKYFPDEVYQEYVDTLNRGRDVNPKLKVYSLDYWDPKDPAEIKKIYETHRKNGFIPYVSTIDLQAVHAEPK